MTPMTVKEPWADRQGRGLSFPKEEAMPPLPSQFLVPSSGGGGKQVVPWMGGLRARLSRSGDVWYVRGQRGAHLQNATPQQRRQSRHSEAGRAVDQGCSGWGRGAG